MSAAPRTMQARLTLRRCASARGWLLQVGAHAERRSLVREGTPVRRSRSCAPRSARDGLGRPAASVKPRFACIREARLSLQSRFTKVDNFRLRQVHRVLKRAPNARRHTRQERETSSAPAMTSSSPFIATSCSRREAAPARLPRRRPRRSHPRRLPARPMSKGRHTAGRPPARDSDGRAAR